MYSQVLVHEFHMFHKDHVVFLNTLAFLLFLDFLHYQHYFHFHRFVHSLFHRFLRLKTPAFLEMVIEVLLDHKAFVVLPIQEVVLVVQNLAQDLIFFYLVYYLHFLVLILILVHFHFFELLQVSYIFLFVFLLLLLLRHILHLDVFLFWFDFCLNQQEFVYYIYYNQFLAGIEAQVDLPFYL